MVLVVGAGPVGCVCARELAKKGVPVSVCEEHREIGSPVQCSGLISAEGLDSLGVDYSSAVLNKIIGATIHSPSMNSMNVGESRVRACVVDRGKLDQIIADSAEGAGAKIELGKRITGADLAQQTDFVVGADGASSSVANHFGFPKMSRFAVCMQADFEGANVRDARRIEMFLSNSRFPGFFGWSIPLAADKARVGMGANLQNAGRLSKLFDRFLASKEIVSEIDGAKKVSSLAGAIPLEPRKKTVSGNVLLVGDAAGQVKSTTGGGIVFGSCAARIAANCISANRDEPSQKADYETAWRRELGTDLALHLRARNFLDSLSDSRMDLLFSLAKNLGAESFLNRFGDMDRPSRMKNEMWSSPLLAACGKILGLG